MLSKGKKNNAHLFKFFQGSGKLPQEYDLAYTSYVLGMSYTELIKQPAEWVEQMIDLHRQKAKSDEYDMKKQEAKTKAQKHFKRR